MNHDFAPIHGGKGGKCDDSHNIMNYGNSRKKWSTCSKLDFQAHYIANRRNWCLESKLKV